MIGFRILGMKDVQAALDATAKELEAAEDPAALAAADPILEAWRSLVPVKDGNYRNALTIAWLGKAGAAVGTRWLNELPREQQPFLYAKPLEFGNSHQSAQPSARPALASARGEAMKAGADPFRSVIRGRTRKRKKSPPKE